MDGVHDMGGMDGFGKVEAEQDEPVFHVDWERRVFAMTQALAYSGAWNIDMSRYSQERIAPQVYLSASYYKRWGIGLEMLLLELGLVDPVELASGRANQPGIALPRRLTPANIDTALRRPSFARPADVPPRYEPGARVRARNIHPRSHTRLPRYARGRVGIVDALRGFHVFPDTVAVDRHENPQWLYTVVLDSRELWGDAADPTFKVSIEAFESYLEPEND